ncbi:hypothetical protein GCM10022279_14190 [Comamonas faecalis]|uniref:DUF2946 domain-containing protein n=1 Tax=Comamonas faecalis TaxID=1387849 RepID=A0ABP7R489_9BURK
MTTASMSKHLQRLRRLALGWLLLALLLSPVLGRMHQVLHGMGSAPTGLVDVAGQGGVANHAPGLLHTLFAGHSHGDCQVLDQQTLGGALLAQALPLVQAAPRAMPEGVPAAAPATRRLASFHARAPPLGG